MLLQTLGCDVRVAYGGAPALAAVPEFKPQLAFVDIGMPGMDGYETARQIRKLPEGKDLILVALSGWGRDEDRQRSKEAGFDHHCVKPMELDALETLLRSLPRTPEAAGKFYRFSVHGRQRPNLRGECPLLAHHCRVRTRVSGLQFREERTRRNNGLAAQADPQRPLGGLNRSLKSAPCGFYFSSTVTLLILPLKANGRRSK